MKKNITIISAHTGAQTWKVLWNYIEMNSNYKFYHFHQYDDLVYRSSASKFSRFIHHLRTYFIFPSRFIINFRKIEKQSDLIIIGTSPFFMPMLAAILIKKKLKLSLKFLIFILKHLY